MQALGTTWREDFGLLDQREGLRWVRRSIRAFGGDEERVLLAGQSSGAGSINFHLVTPGSRGLFSRIAPQGSNAGLSDGPCSRPHSSVNGS